MSGTAVVDGVAMAHLVALSMWGGVVATEAVIEVRSFRFRESEAATSRFHYWIDLLVELPLVLAVIASGITLVCLANHASAVHVIKIGCGAVAIGVNLFCIAVVLRRERRSLAGATSDQLRRASRVVLACFAGGLLFAAVAAVLGFALAVDRIR